MKNEPKLIPQILKKGKIKLMSLEVGLGSTGEAHLAFLNGKKYALRICKDEETSKKYYKYYQKFKKYNFLPKMLEKQGKYILFEFIKGRMSKEKETKSVVYQVGRICAIINKVKAEYDYQKRRIFFTKLNEVKENKMIPEELIQKVEETYNELDKKVKLLYALDAGDITNDNFIVNNKGKTYFVDIEAIKPNIKGMGIAKGYSSWFRDEEDKTIFKKGYESISSMKFYTKNYAKLVTLIFFIQRIRGKYNKGEHKTVERTIIKLTKLLEK